MDGAVIKDKIMTRQEKIDKVETFCMQRGGCNAPGECPLDMLCRKLAMEQYDAKHPHAGINWEKASDEEINEATEKVDEYWILLDNFHEELNRALKAAFAEEDAINKIAESLAELGIINVCDAKEIADAGLSDESNV